MATIHKGDFIEINYTGRLKDSGEIFDTTEEKAAKENNLPVNAEFGSVTICLGEGQILRGLDKELEEKEEGGEYKIELKAENAFGKKDAKLLKMMPTSVFTKQQITPMPGLQVNIDGVVGRILNVTGGRTIVDFNHPLASKDVVYEIKIVRKILDIKERIISIFKMANFNEDFFEVNIENDKAKITLKKKLHDNAKINEEYKKQLAEKIEQLAKIKAEFVEAINAKNAEAAETK